MSESTCRSAALAGLLAITLTVCVPLSQAFAAARVNGYVYDTLGNPVSQALVTIKADANQKGPDYFTAFSDAQGRVGFPDALTGVADPERQLSARVLGYALEKVVSKNQGDGQTLTVILRRTTNYADTAPASAWLSKLDDSEKETLLNSCVACHQTLIRQQRNYGRLIAESAANANVPDPVAFRKKAWLNLMRYMGFLGSHEFDRRVRTTKLPGPALEIGNSNAADAGDAYFLSAGHAQAANLISKVTDQYGPTLEYLDHYDYGAPLAVTPETVILEYEVARPNSIREAVMMGKRPKLYVADSSSRDLIEIDVASGEQRRYEVPLDAPGPGPHSLYRSDDGTLWVSSTSEVVGQFDPDKKTWRGTWPLRAHDLALGLGRTGRTFATDYKGRIWKQGESIGYLDPRTGEKKDFRIPKAAGRADSQFVYSAVFLSDRKRLWYTMPQVGVFGEFNAETLTFEKQMIMPEHSAPHRLTITEDDILYVPLMDAGQLAKYDARAGKLLGNYDLPDRAAVPYAATYDPVRKVIWTANSNADSIYRFDIKTETWSVLPLPRQNAFLRMVDVDPETGLLITSYANLPYPVHGPRMALIIDPGDHAYPMGKDAISHLLAAQ